MATPDATTGHYIGVVTPAQTMFHDVSDGAVVQSVGHYLVMLDFGSVLVLASFTTDVAALCWLTNPLIKESVINASPVADTPPNAAENVGWLAVHSASSCAVFDLSRDGAERALAMTSTVAVGVTVARRFASAQAGMMWLCGEGPKDLLDILSADCAPTVSAPPPPVSGGSPVADKAVGLFPITPSCAGHGNGSGPCGQAPASLELECINATLGAPRAACSQVHDVRKLSTHQLEKPTAPPVNVATKTVRVASRRCSGAASSTKRMVGVPSTPPTFSMLKPGGAGGRADRKYEPDDLDWEGIADAFCSSDRDAGAWAGEPVPGSEACNPSLKKRKVAAEPGKVDPRNPPGASRESTSGMFSRASITRMFADFRRHYEELDKRAAAAAATGKQRSGVVVSVKAGVCDDALDKVTCSGKDGNATRSPAVGINVACSSGRSVVAGAKDVVWPEAEDAHGVADSGAPSTAVGHRMPPSGGGNGEAYAVALGTAPSCESRRSGGEAVHDGGAVLGPLSRLAADGQWDALIHHMLANPSNTFISGGPGVGKTTFLKRFCGHLRQKFKDDGQVVVCAPTGSAAKTAAGSTYHSFFGFPLRYQPEKQDPVLEAARLLATNKFKPIHTRLARVRVLLLDEISMVPADRFDVMVQLLVQSRAPGAEPCVVYAFGDFLQLRPTDGRFAFEAKCWVPLFRGSFLDLTLVHRQRDRAFITAIRDARFGLFSSTLRSLIAERTVSDAAYRALECRVLHLMPTHKDVAAHNTKCLKVLCPRVRPSPFVCVDSVEIDKSRDETNPPPAVNRVSDAARSAALADCVAPREVTHCLHARVMYTSNAKHVLGIFHGSIGYICEYLPDATAVVRFPDTPLPKDVRLQSMGVRNAGDSWIDVECPAVDFEAPLLAHPGAVAVRKQVPFVLGWAITIHRSQSLTLSEAVLDLAKAFEAGMVHAAVSRVSTKERLFIKSFAQTRLFADASAVDMYLRVWQRL